MHRIKINGALAIRLNKKKEPNGLVGGLLSFGLWSLLVILLLDFISILNFLYFCNCLPNKKHGKGWGKVRGKPYAPFPHAPFCLCFFLSPFIFSCSFLLYVVVQCLFHLWLVKGCQQVCCHPFCECGL